MSILIDADKLINGARQETYGSPLDNWSNTAKGWSIILGKEITPEQACLCMTWVKICREVNLHKMDNLVDIAGYTGLIERIINERNTRQRGREVLGGSLANSNAGQGANKLP